MTNATACGARAALALLLALATSTAAAEPRSVRAVALEDEAAPNGLGDYASVYSRISASDDGHIAWGASLQGPGFVAGAFVEDADGATRTVLDGSSGPAELGGILDAVFEPDVRDGGEIAFQARGAEPASLQGWLRDAVGGQTFLARENDPVPGLPGATWSWNPSDIEINDSGQVSLYTPFVQAAVFEQGVFRFDGTVPTLLVRTGATLPGSGGEQILVLDDSTGESFNDAGDISFQVTLTPSFRRAVYRRTDGAGITPVAIELDPAPVPEDLVYTFPSVGADTINQAGDVAFVTTLMPPDLSGTGEEAIAFAPSGGSVEVLLREGADAPGGGVFGELAALSLDDSGTIAFLGVADDGMTSRQGIYLLRDGSVETIVQEGDEAPSAAGATYQNFSVRSVRLTERGAVTFRANLSDGRGGLFVSEPKRSALPASSLPVLALAMLLTGGVVLVRSSRTR